MVLGVKSVGMTDDECAFLSSHYEQSQNAFEEAIGDVEPGLWSRVPEPGRWSVWQCASHIVQVESRIFGRIGTLATMQDQASEQEDASHRDALVLQIPSRAKRVKAPEAMEPPKDGPGKDELLTGFRRAHGELTDLIDRNPPWLRGRYVEHPMLKELDGYQWLLAASGHTLRHVAQIQEVKQQIAVADAAPQLLPD